MADLDLKAVHDEMVSVAYEAGAMILAANPAELDTDTKLNCMNLPTLSTSSRLTSASC